MRRLFLAGGILAATLLSGAAAIAILAPDPRPLLRETPGASVEVVDRYGGLLRHDPGRDGIRWQPVDPSRVSPHVVHAVLAAEDHRFRVHPGVDPLSLARACWQNLRAGRVVSGGSTLTMQLARILDPRPRGIGAKLAQIAMAARLEATLGKDGILAAYLSRAPFGNRVVGYEAAARVYLGKPASQLSPAEAALLAGVPRSPAATNPWRSPGALRSRRDRILTAMARLGTLDDASYRAALAERVVLASDPFRSAAPHFVARAIGEAGSLPSGAVRLETTLDPELQRRVEVIVRRRLDDLALHGVEEMAVAVLDLRRGEWLALEGSGSDRRDPGATRDGTRAPRQPGSALKPFTYAAAFDLGFTPATVIPDLPHAFVSPKGTWIPRNYDERFHGPLRARQALACSVNVPAAFVLDAVSAATLLDTLERAGITTLRKGPEYYGLGLTLGAGEVRLDELTLAHAALLRGGEWRPASAWRAARDARGRAVATPALEPPRRVCSPEAAAQVDDILADPEARAPAFGAWSVLRLPFPASVKTGTSEGFRDNWCVGGTREVVVGVWCGNFSRAPMGNVSGVAGAGTVWREVMLAWAEMHPMQEGARTLPDPPPGMVRSRVCALSGLAPTPACPRTVLELFRAGQAPAKRCDWHVGPPGGATVVAWPPLYRDWAAAEGLLAETGAAPARDDDGPRIDPTRGAPLAVTAPSDGDAFMLVPDLPRRFQSLELRCAIRGAPREVIWIVDGSEVARVASPYAARWPLSPGVHRIETLAGSLRSRPVTITVFGG